MVGDKVRRMGSAWAVQSMLEPSDEVVEAAAALVRLIVHI